MNSEKYSEYCLSCRKLFHYGLLPNVLTYLKAFEIYFSNDLLLYSYFLKYENISISLCIKYDISIRNTLYYGSKECNMLVSV